MAEQNKRIGEYIDEMRVEMDVDPRTRAITILECRPSWHEDSGPEWTRQEIARLRYTKSTGLWTLYWPDRNSKFHRRVDLAPTSTIDRLLRRDRHRSDLHILGLTRWVSRRARTVE